MTDLNEKALMFAASHQRAMLNGAKMRRRELPEDAEKLQELADKLERLQAKYDKAKSEYDDKVVRVDDMESQAEALKPLMARLKRPKESYADMTDDEYIALCYGIRQEISEITSVKTFLGIGDLNVGF